MGCRILSDHDSQQAALYCSTSDWAFGPVFTGDREHDAVERAEAFLRWIAVTPTWFQYEQVAPMFRSSKRDPRELTDHGLATAHSVWLAQEPAQWIAEDEAERVRFAEEL